MRKRFLWTILISAVAISLVIPVNITLLNDVSSEGQSRLNFFALIFVQALLIINTTFVIINQFFTLHPDYHSLIEQHKNITGIPEKYYEPVGKDEESK